MTLTALIFSFSAAICMATFALLSRVLSVKSVSPLAFSVVYGLGASLVSIPLFFVGEWRFVDITPFVLFLTFVATVCFGVFEATEFFARKYIEASRFTVLFQITPVVTFLSAAIFLGEAVTLEKITAIVLVLLGNSIALYKSAGAVSGKGLFFGLIAVTALGLGYVVDKAVVTHYPIGFYVFLTYFFPALYCILVMKLRGEPLRNIGTELSLNASRLFLLALVSVAGYYFVMTALTLTEASLAIPIIFSSTLFVSAGGILFLKERFNIPQKLVGALFVFSGILLLAL